MTADAPSFSRYFDPRFESRFSPGDSASSPGSYAKYLGSGNSGGALAPAFSMLNRGVPVPDTKSKELEDSMAAQADSFLTSYLDDGLGQVLGAQNLAMNTGFSGLSALQTAKQQEELAKLGAQSAQSGAMWSGLSSLATIGGAFIG